jgi:hypothetical protein
VSTRSTGPLQGRKILVVKQSHALAALIDEVRSANGWSDPDVVTRAASKGHKLSKSNISRIRNNPVVTLNIETVSALADGLGISKAMVAQAALASMGIVTYNSADLTTEEAIRRDPSLGEREKRTLLAVLGTLRGDTVKKDTDEAEQTHLAAREERRRRLQDSGYVSPGQKNELTDHAETPLEAKRRAGQLISDRKARERRTSDNEDNNIPLPDDYEQLAADTGHTRHIERERDWMQQGEESQDTDDE